MLLNKNNARVINIYDEIRLDWIGLDWIGLDWIGGIVYLLALEYKIKRREAPRQ